jgi:uncharacterized protein (TIGR02231 family)
MTGFILTVALAVSSQVTDVTVYNDRAQVVREAQVELEAGLHTLRFEELPAGIDSRGIQVDGFGPATVMDVRYRTENFNTVPQERWQALYDQEEALEDVRKAVEQRKKAYAASKEFLLKIGSKVTSANQQEGEEQLDPVRWEKMLDMYLQQQLAYDADILAAELEIQDLDEKLNKIKADLRTLGANRKKQRQVVEVDVDVASAGSVVLQLSYLVRGPTWEPAYDVRVDTASRTMEVKTYALIRQNSGEDWKDVTLRLSTANPGLGGQHAVLQPWRLKVREVQDQSKAEGGREVYMVAPNSFSRMQNSYDTGDMEVTSVSAADVVSERGADIARQGTAVLFTPEGVSSVESDNVEHRIAVSSVELPSHFRYSAVPKLDAHAYLKAKVKNSSNHPFLAGSANIFLDGSYVTSSHLKSVPQGEEFWVFLGVDAGMTIQYKQIKRYESNEGRNKVRHTCEYLIEVKNTHDKPEEFIIWDQLPVSENEAIEVELLTPRYTKDTPSLKMDDSGRLQWFKPLEPGEEWTIPFSYQVQAPERMEMEGF